MKLSVFDIIGPVMVGPSSSHTAGAARIGKHLNALLRGRLKRVEITLFNSFADTGHGHGTRHAVLGGILGFSEGDGRLKQSFEFASSLGVTVVFSERHDDSFHPNSAIVVAETSEGRFCGFGESLGGGLVSFREVALEKA